MMITKPNVFAGRIRLQQECYGERCIHETGAHGLASLQPHWVPVRYDLEEEKPEGNSGSADGAVVYTALQFTWLQDLCAPHAAWKNDYYMCGEYVLLRTTLPSSFRESLQAIL